jgi:hypothetical protein
MQNRRVPIDAALRPLLEAMRKEVNGKGLVFPVYPVAEHTARSLRDWLRRAGVKRAELHRDSPTHKNITFHDLRASGLTWMAIRGDDPLKIQQRAGHADFNTTQGYIRTAEAVREGFGVPFPVLPVTLHLGAPGAANDHSIDHPELTIRNLVEAPGIEFAEKSQENVGVSRRSPAWRVHPGGPLSSNEYDRLRGSAAGFGNITGTARRRARRPS